MFFASARVLRCVSRSVISIGTGATLVTGCSVTLDPTFREGEGSASVEPAPDGAGGGNNGGAGNGNGGAGNGGAGNGGAGNGGEDGGTEPLGSAGGPSVPRTLRLVGSSPASGETGVATDTDIALEFDRDITLLAGDFTVHRTLDGSAFETVDTASSGVVVEGGTMTVDLDGVLAGNTTYTLTLDERAVEGVDGAAFAGIPVDDAISFTTSAVTLPGDVSDGLVLWLDAAFTTTLKADAGRVVVWGDRSGNNYSVKQSSSSAQPSLVGEAIGSNAVVRFDGSSDVLAGPVLESLLDYDVFIVWQSTIEPPSGGQTHLLRNGASLEVNHGHDQLAFRYAGASLFDTWVAAQFEQPTPNTLSLWNLSFDSTAGTLTAFTDGSISATTTGLVGSPASTDEPLTVGSRWDLARHFTGDIGEILIYRRTLEATERSGVQLYLDDKWRP